MMMTNDEKESNPGEDSSALMSCTVDQPDAAQMITSFVSSVRENKKKEEVVAQYAKIDRFFLIFTPFLFLVFNSIYWGYFLLWDMLVCYQTDTE